MSRSKKKPYITDQNGSKPGRGQAAKRNANKAIRNLNKKAVAREPDAETASGKAYRKESCSWNIRDWSFHDPKNPKARRK